MDAIKFGSFVASVRKEKNMTQAGLATKIQVTDKAVSRWERGLGFPDINTLEPLSDALEISILELMRSEKIETDNIHCKDAANIITDTLREADRQRILERKQERKLIAIAIGSVALLSVFILLVDHIGWSLQNIIFTSVGVVLPIVCGLAIFALAVLAIIRKCMGKSCRQIAIAFLIFVGILVVMVILFFVLGMMAFPGQK